MTVQRDTLLCRYHYDPLDQVVNCAALNQQSIQRFYQKSRLATEIQGQSQYSMFAHEDHLLAQQQRQAGNVDCALLATDLQRSVLHSIVRGQHQQPVYAPYGHRSPESGLSSLLGFNGERRDPVTGHYLLGNGYRAFNPVLMRFNSPDSLSPFGKGGVNAYAYCVGDPVNRVDPTGHFFKFFQGFRGIGSGIDVGGTVSRARVLKAFTPIEQNVSTLQDLAKGRQMKLQSFMAEYSVSRDSFASIKRRPEELAKNYLDNLASTYTVSENLPSTVRYGRSLGLTDAEILKLPKFSNKKVLADVKRAAERRDLAERNLNRLDEALSQAVAEYTGHYPRETAQVLQRAKRVRSGNASS